MKYYRETKEWADFRKEAIKRADGRCQLCNSSENLHVHHRLYVETAPAAVVDVIDLTVLCGRCHLYFHRGQQRKHVGGDNRVAPKPDKKKKVVTPRGTIKVVEKSRTPPPDLSRILPDENDNRRHCVMRDMEESMRKAPRAYKGAVRAKGANVI